MRSDPPQVVVVGSLNLDYIASVDRLPDAGQTVAAGSLVRRFGGKGANQAVAAARQEANVRLIGCVGAEAEGRSYLERLRREGIDVSGITSTRSALTGTALIAVDRAGENTIIVAPGANGTLLPGTLKRVNLFSPKPDVLLLQFEVPMATVIESVRSANLGRVPVVLNPSPLRNDFPWTKGALDSLIVNAGEARAIFGMEPSRIKTQLERWRKAMVKRRIEKLIVTRSAASTLCVTQDEYLDVPTPKVKPVDTVGAGDAFAGAYAAARGAGLDLAQALRLANCAGALTTLRIGAQEAIPTAAATRRLLK